MNRKGFSTLAIVGAIMLAGIIVGAGFIVSAYLREETVTITVKDKERIVERGGGDAKYLIWTEDETFENIDSLFKGKFNSSDLYGQLEEGNTYQCRVYGLRNGFFSMYRNIVNCKEYIENPFAHDYGTVRIEKKGEQE